MDYNPIVKISHPTPGKQTGLFILLVSKLEGSGKIPYFSRRAWENLCLCHLPYTTGCNFPSILLKLWPILGKVLCVWFLDLR